MLRAVRTSLTVLILMTFLLGALYPLCLAAMGALFWPDAAQGSVILMDGTPRGSRLLAQDTTDPRYFWPRPSATDGFPTNSMASGASHFSAANPRLLQRIKERLALIRAADPSYTESFPVDWVTASASGLDPHISPAAAYVQVRRIAETRGLDSQKVRAIVDALLEGKQWGLLGAPRVNVLELNMALDRMTGEQTP